MLEKALFPVFARHWRGVASRSERTRMFHGTRKVLENKARRAYMKLR